MHPSSLTSHGQELLRRPWLSNSSSSQRGKMLLNRLGNGSLGNKTPRDLGSTRNSPICEADKTILTSKAFLFPPSGAMNSKKRPFYPGLFCCCYNLPGLSTANQTESDRAPQAVTTSPLPSLSTVESPAFGMPRMPVRWAEGSESPFAGNAKIKLRHPCGLAGILTLPGLDKSFQA